MNLINKKSILNQLIRFGIVGFISNLMLYFFYIILTEFKYGHKTSMTIVFLLGVTQTFIFNKKWSFSVGCNSVGYYYKYFLSYCLTYIINLIGLFLFVDILYYPHELVQGVMVIFCAFLLFIILKLWVFKWRGHVN